MISTILGLIKLSLEVFQDERKDMYLKRYIKIKREFDAEINKGLDNWSDIRINELLFEAETLGKIIIKETSPDK